MTCILWAVGGLLIGWLIARWRYRCLLRRACAEAQLDEMTRLKLATILSRMRAI